MSDIAGRAAAAVAGGGEAAATRLLLGAVHLYRLLLSPLLGPCCRYLPSCSEYALDALRRHGPLRGGRLALGRLARCHPWGGHGHDPVPR